MTKKPSRWKHWRSTVINLGTIFVLLLAVSFLPADTSLSQIKARGTLKLCVPASYPPFVTGNPEHPGYDIELVQAIADKLGVRLAINKMESIGRDFNPRNWMISRGQCDILAGGVADTLRTRNFMQTIPTDIQLGWMLLSLDGVIPQKGDQIFVIPGNTGLNRLELSGWLRNQGLNARSISMRVGEKQVAQQVFTAIANGDVKGLVAENFTACSLLKAKGSEAKDVKASWVFSTKDENGDVEQGRTMAGQTYSMALGLWKGDVTLKRAVEKAIKDLDKNGQTTKLREFYMGNSIICDN
ncbi:substrate-binding periplasmic protein [Paenochrobactrum sp. BZR 588]|uniref:substrate-binding periplasmic protein n=1 Tax=unclassified Paenochrobactrum TaxID=2639760 RepID=UPI0038553305